MFVIAGTFVTLGFALLLYGFTIGGAPGLQATAAACFFGILARMAQASGAHDQILKFSAPPSIAPTPTVAPDPTSPKAPE